MISGEIGENCMITGAQTGLNQRDSTKSCVISDWYPFPNKEVCGGLGFFNITFQLSVFLLCNLHFEYMWLIIVVPSQYVVATLVLGHLHSILSRSTYDRVRSMFTSYHVALPHWDTLRRTRDLLRSMVNLEIHQNLSVLSNRTYHIGLKSIIGLVSAILMDSKI